MSEEWASFSKCPSVAALQQETIPGYCVFCEKAMKQGRNRTRFVCFRTACQAAYQAEYKRWRREKFNAQGLTQRGGKRKSQHPRWKPFLTTNKGS